MRKQVGIEGRQKNNVVIKEKSITMKEGENKVYVFMNYDLTYPIGVATAFERTDDGKMWMEINLNDEWDGKGRFYDEEMDFDMCLVNVESHVGRKGTRVVDKANVGYVNLTVHPFGLDSYGK